MANIDNDNKDIKLILLGESGVGKTCLINAYFDQKFSYNQLSTLSETETKKYLRINDKIIYFVNIWDTVGQERYRSLTKSFIKDTNIVIFVYDITKRESFLELNYWINLTNEVIGNDNLILGIAANKMDLFIDSKVEPKEGKEEAEKIGASFIEVSAKDNPNSFKDFINNLIREYITKQKIEIEKFEFIGLKDIPKNSKKQLGYGKKKKKCC